MWGRHRAVRATRSASLFFVAEIRERPPSDELPVEPLGTLTGVLTLGFSMRGGWNVLRGIGEWRRRRSGPITSHVAEPGCFVRTRSDLPVSDIEVELLIAIVDDHNRKMHLGHGFCLHVTVMRPASRGEVRLKDRDPRTPPAIDPRYFSTTEDMATLVRGVQVALRIVDDPAMERWRGTMLSPLTPDDYAGIEREMRRSADTEYHPVGTCRMGPASDPTAVVDPQLRVHGIGGLRVADASIMPAIVTGNTNAPCVMIGEKAADLVLGRPALRATPS